MFCIFSSFIYPNILVVVLLRPVIASVDEEDKLFKSFFTLVRFMLIAVTSIGVGGSTPLPSVIASIILWIPRYNEIAATPSADFAATAPTLSIARSCAANFPRSIIAYFSKPSISSWKIQKPANLWGKRILYGW